jgi:DNA-binding NarL/FixJ family response regulator
MTRIVIVDDHELLAFSLACALQAQGFDATALRPTTREEVLGTLLADPPSVLLLDLQIGGEIGSGATLVRPLADAGIRVVMVSGVTDRAEIAVPVEAGAAGYVAKSEPFEVLIETAARAARGESLLDEAERHALLAELRRHRAEAEAQRAPFEQLTPREAQVLRALCAGESVTSIATSWFVSVPTVRTQVRAILLKLGAGSQLEAVALAHRCGWAAEAERRSA